MIGIDDLIRESNELQALPMSAARLATIFSNEDWELEDVVTAISLDPAITSRVLRMANSAAVGGIEEITSVDRAVQRLGAGTVLALTIGIGARATLSRSMPEYDVAEGALWRHGVASALAAELERGVCSVKVPAEAFTAALLHDVGKIVMSQHMEPIIMEFLTQAQSQGGMNSLRAEEEILGIHHGELGGLIAQHWELPEIIVKAIHFHHNPEDALDPHVQLISDAVCVADAAADTCGFGLSDTIPPSSDHLGSRERLGMTDAGFEELCEMLGERVEEVLSWYE